MNGAKPLSSGRSVELGMVTLRKMGCGPFFDGDSTIEEILKYTLTKGEFMPKFNYVAMDSRGKETKALWMWPTKRGH